MLSEIFKIQTLKIKTRIQFRQHKTSTLYDRAKAMKNHIEYIFIIFRLFSLHNLMLS